MNWYNVDGTVKQISEGGIYFNMPLEVYHAQKAVSNSGLKDLLKSEYRYWYKSALNPNKQPFKKTPALISGQKFHKYLLERPDFFNDYAVKSGVQTSNAVCKETGKEFVGEGELNDIKEAVRVLEELLPKTVNTYLRGARTEVSMFWQDARTGVMCRCRHDIFKPFASVDYKTTTDATHADCIAAMVNYDYFMQAAFYLEGNKQVFKHHLTDEVIKKLQLTDEDLATIEEHQNYCFLFQEKTAPFTPYMITVEDDMLEHGRSQVALGLQRYVNALEKYGEDKPWYTTGDRIHGVSAEDLELNNKGWYLHKKY